MIQRSVKLSLQTSMKLMLKKLLPQTRWPPPPRMPCFHRILHCNNKFTKRAKQKAAFLHLFSLLTAFMTEHLPQTYGYPNTLDKSSIYTCNSSTYQVQRTLGTSSIQGSWSVHRLVIRSEHKKQMQNISKHNGAQQNPTSQETMPPHYMRPSHLDMLFFPS